MMSLRDSVPCCPDGGATNAAALSRLPPPAAGSAIHTGWPGTMLARGLAPPILAVRTEVLKGKPDRATTCVSSDQSRVKLLSAPFLPAPGSAHSTAAEKEWRTSKPEEA